MPSYEDSDFDLDVNEFYRELRYAEDGETKEILAVLRIFANSDGNAYAESVFNGECLEFDIEPVPEPATMLLFGLGALGFGAFRRKKEVNI